LVRKFNRTEEEQRRSGRAWNGGEEIVLVHAFPQSFLSVLEGKGGSRIVIEPLELTVSQPPAGLGAYIGGCMVVGSGLMGTEKRDRSEQSEMEMRRPGMADLMLN